MPGVGRREVLLALAGAAACLLVLPAPCAARAPLGPIAVIVHPEIKHPPRTAAELRRLFLKRQTRWPDGSPVVVLNLPARTTARSAFDRALLGLSPHDAARYWIDRKVRGKGQPPRSLTSPLLIQKVVATHKEAIAYVPLAKVRPGVRVLAVVDSKKGTINWAKADG